MGQVSAIISHQEITEKVCGFTTTFTATKTHHKFRYELYLQSCVWEYILHIFLQRMYTKIPLLNESRGD